MPWGHPLPFVTSSQVEQLDYISEGEQELSASGTLGTAWHHLAHEEEQRRSAPKGRSQKALLIHCQTGI